LEIPDERTEGMRMRVIGTVVAALMLMGVGVATAEDKAPKKVTFTGTVVDASAKPVAGAEVSGGYWSLPEDGRGVENWVRLGGVKTKPDGTFVMELPLADAQTGNCSMVIRKAGKFPASVVWSILEDRTERIVLGEEATISGTVVDKKTGKGADGMTLLIRRMDDPSDPARDSRQSKVIDGKFTVGQLSAGRYRISLAPPHGKMPNQVALADDITVESGQKVTAAKVELITGGVIEVVLRDAKTQQPVAGSVVTLSLCPAGPTQPIKREIGFREGMLLRHQRVKVNSVAGADGVARFLVLPGQYELSFIQGPDQYISRYFHTLGEGPRATVKDGKTARLSVLLNTKPKITGVVRDKAGNPVEGAMVAVGCGIGIPVRTGKDGRFELLAEARPKNESRGEFLIVRHAGRKLAAATILDDCLEAEITLGPAASVTGRVIGPQGKPLAGARVYLSLIARRDCFSSPSWADVKTNTQGRYTADVLPVGLGHYRLMAAIRRYGREEQRVKCDRPGLMTLPDIVLQRADRLVSGVVVDVNGQPVAGATVWEDDKQLAETDASGKFEIKDLARGPVRLVVLHGDQSGSGNVAAGDTEVRVVVRKWSSDD